MDNPPDPQRHIFPFFDLPAELRNEVYDFSLGNVETHIRKHVKAQTTNVASINLLLVSRQFNQEYADRAESAKEFATLKLSETPCNCPSNIALPPSAKTIKHVTFELAFDETNVVEMYEKSFKHLRRITFVLKQMRTVKTLDFRHHFIDWREEEFFGVEYAFFWLRGDKLLKLSCLTKLECYFLDEQKHPDTSIWDFDDKAKLSIKWNKETGKLEYVKSEQWRHIKMSLAIFISFADKTRIRPHARLTLRTNRRQGAIPMCEIGRRWRISEGS